MLRFLSYPRPESDYKLSGMFSANLVIYYTPLFIIMQLIIDFLQKNLIYVINLFGIA
jgi:hypothetical protein